ncbi:MAG: hypothetical protein GX882_07315, partial [Methanomicrobiales archaeon]|nr:hypothetical protein [Methanomicrobiales archaeon]
DRRAVLGHVFVRDGRIVNHFRSRHGGSVQELTAKGVPPGEERGGEVQGDCRLQGIGIW